MICMYLNLNEHQVKYKKDNKIHTITEYIPQDCKKNVCPFYSDGTGDYMEGVCIRAEKEKME
jgi:hypothetical protein